MKWIKNAWKIAQKAILILAEFLKLLPSKSNESVKIIAFFLLIS